MNISKSVTLSSSPRHEPDPLEPHPLELWYALLPQLGYLEANQPPHLSVPSTHPWLRAFKIVNPSGYSIAFGYSNLTYFSFKGVILKVKMSGLLSSRGIENIPFCKDLNAP